MNLKQLDTFHKTKAGYLAFGLVELGLWYIFTSLAINSGAWWQWLLAVIFFVGAAQNFVRLVTLSIKKLRTSK